MLFRLVRSPVHRFQAMRKAVEGVFRKRCMCNWFFENSTFCPVNVFVGLDIPRLEILFIFEASIMVPWNGLCTLSSGVIIQWHIPFFVLRFRKKCGIRPYSISAQPKLGTPAQRESAQKKRLFFGSALLQKSHFSENVAYALIRPRSSYASGN